MLYEDISQYFAPEYNINEIDVKVIDGIKVYEMRKSKAISKSFIYLVVSEATCISDFIDHLNSFLQPSKARGVMCIVHDSLPKQLNDFPMMLFNDRYRLFMHFVYWKCDGTVQFDTDFYYVGAREMKKIMLKIVQLLESKR